MRREEEYERDLENGRWIQLAAVDGQALIYIILYLLYIYIHIKRKLSKESLNPSFYMSIHLLLLLPPISSSSIYTIVL